MKALGQLAKDRAEPESDPGALGAGRIDADRGNSNSLCDGALSKEDIERAAYLVQKGEGAPGADGMAVYGLEDRWKEDGEAEEGCIRALRHRPKPVRGVDVPKPDGGARTLGIPCVAGRMARQAVPQAVNPPVDPAFSGHPHGFRPGRSARRAIGRARKPCEEGRKAVVDVDLGSCFGTVGHGMPAGLVEKAGATDKVIPRIIGRSPVAGIMDGGIATRRAEGTPRGGPLPPLPSDVYLDVLDKELERRGRRFARCADDASICVKSRRAGGRVLESAAKFLEAEPGLSVNPGKSEAGSPGKLKFPGFSLGKGAEGACTRAHPASVKRLGGKMRAIAKRGRGISPMRMPAELKRALMGRIDYYGIAECKGLCGAAGEWLRRRIRQYAWKQWKAPKARRGNLRALGIAQEQACMWGCSRKGYRRAAGSAILNRAPNNRCLNELGLFSMLDHCMTKCVDKRTATCGTA